SAKHHQPEARARVVRLRAAQRPRPPARAAEPLLREALVRASAWGVLLERMCLTFDPIGLGRQPKMWRKTQARNLTIRGATPTEPITASSPCGRRSFVSRDHAL